MQLPLEPPYGVSVSFDDFIFEFDDNRDHAIMWSVISIVLVWMCIVTTMGRYERYLVRTKRRRILDDKMAGTSSSSSGGKRKGKGTERNGEKEGEHSPVEWILHTLGASGILGDKHEEAKEEEDDDNHDEGLLLMQLDC